ncbi:MAG: VWA domain-containing protein [Acidobacteria bacterium]|nr:VWA domain-containing protein [Acidobacteriota bacterium]
MRLTSPLVAAGTTALILLAQQHQLGGQVPADPALVFRSGVDLVSVAAVVRDRRGHVVRDLDAGDFEVYDNGVRRRIVEFAPGEDGPISVAFLLDVSGSMRMSRANDAARGMLDHLLAWLDPSRDEAALFTFDAKLYEEHGFTSDVAALRGAMAGIEAFGVTSLYDAVGETAERVASRDARRRAVVVLTDGLDNASRLTPEDVSAIASRSDVPVYVVTLVSSLDQPHRRMALGGPEAVNAAGPLGHLAWWSGGNLFIVSTAGQASVAARTMVAELRHQYLLAFESSGAPGWRTLDVRLRRADLSIRARSAYYWTPLRTLG